jgi:hypothetical protein
VYPAQVYDGTAQRVRITARFDEPMDPARATVAWGAAGGPPTELAGSWIDPATLVVDIVAPPFTGQRPLEDDTAYAVDLSALRDAAHNPVEPDVVLDAGMLRFTTGRYDALLNHACGHVELGPFATVTAAAAPGPTIARTDTAHTRYTIAVPEPTTGGFTRGRAVAAATWTLFLDGPVPIDVQTERGVAVAAPIAPAPAACAGITHRLAFDAEADDRFYFHVGPGTAPEHHLILEIVAR